MILAQSDFKTPNQALKELVGDKIKLHLIKEGTGRHDSHILGVLNLENFQYFHRITAGHSGPWYLNSQTVNNCQAANKLSFLVAAVSAVTSFFHTIVVDQ